MKNAVIFVEGLLTLGVAVNVKTWLLLSQDQADAILLSFALTKMKPLVLSKPLTLKLPDADVNTELEYNRPARIAVTSTEPSVVRMDKP